MKLYSKRQQLNSTGSIKFYLLVAMKNELFNIFRKNITFYSIHTMEYDLASDIQLEDKLISDEESIERNNMISQILEILTPRQREVIYYRYIEELSFAEIEQLMQINVQSIQNLIQRSIKKVREKFPDYVLYALFPIIFQ
ncbi:MAG: sigma-70 family RNA polymerase sigma factor [Parabacteroides chartae]|nr:sigma-70 family RNA polymerase sigma factor [Parabacteroides chartae]